MALKVLLITATDTEAEALRRIPEIKSCPDGFLLGQSEICLLVTGVGSIATSWAMTKWLSSNPKPDLAINIGIAGSFRDEISIGTVVNVKSEQFCDFGIEEADHVKTVFDAGYVDPDEFPFRNGKLVNPNWFENLEIPAVHGVTGNISHGAADSIARIKKDFDPDIESMEGAAIFYVCLFEKVPFLEIRAISNYVDIRDTEKWDIPSAIENLTDELFRFLRKFANVKQLS